MKKRIGINIDGILRNYLDRFEKIYISTYISNPSIVDTTEEFAYKELTEEEQEAKALKIQDEIKKKVKKPFDSYDLLNHFHFDAGKNYLGEEVDAQGKLSEFMYELKTFNIFGQAEAYRGSFDALHELQLIGKETEAFDVVLLSHLNSKAITATFTFLGNNGCRAKNISFVNHDFEKWDHCDVLIDIAPESLQSKPEDKISVKIEQPYNIWDSADYTFTTLKDAVRDKDFIDKIVEFCRK